MMMSLGAGGSEDTCSLGCCCCCRVVAAAAAAVGIVSLHTCVCMHACTQGVSIRCVCVLGLKRNEMK